MRRLLIKSATDIIAALLNRHSSTEKPKPDDLCLEDVIVTKAIDYLRRSSFGETLR